MPLPSGLVEKNGSKILSLAPAGMPSRAMTCDENMIVRMPTATSTSVTNRPKLSPEMTP